MTVFLAFTNSGVFDVHISIFNDDSIDVEILDLSLNDLSTMATNVANYLKEKSK